MHSGRADLGDDVAGRLGVDDHQVVVALAHLVGELADAEDLLHAGGGVGDEVEGAGERPDAPDERHADEQAEVLAQRVLGVHVHAEQVALELARLELEVAGIERGGEGVLGVHRAHQRAPAAASAEQGERGCDRRLADPTLAGDEQQLMVEQRRHAGLTRSLDGGMPMR